MREKQWVNCPSCGAQGSMKLKKRVYDTFKSKDYDPIKVGPLGGYFCRKCNDGIYTLASRRVIQPQLAEGRAKQDSDRVVASELMTVEEAVRKLNKSRQRVHQMMKEGKIRYVFVGTKRIPIRKALLKAM